MHASMQNITSISLFCITKVTLLIRMWNVDHSYMTILLNLKLIAYILAYIIAELQDKSCHAWSICGMRENSRNAGQSRKMRDNPTRTIHFK